MTINRLIRLVSKHYDDNYILATCWNSRASRPNTLEEYDHAGGGDTLAHFIAVELYETFSAFDTDAHQLDEAIRVMDSASRQISAITAALQRKRAQLRD